MPYTAYWLPASDDTPLYIHLWASEAPRGVVMLSHGMAEHAGRYARLGLASPARRRQSLGNWQKLVRAIVARDGDAAEATHRRLSMQNLAAGLAELDRRARAGREDERRPAPRRRR